MSALAASEISARFVKEITASWRASLEGILEVGRLLMQAKDCLPHGDFAQMIESNLPFGARTAQRLMAIAADTRLSNPTHVSLLPPSWGTLYEISKLDDEALAAAIEKKIIRPDMERNVITKVFGHRNAESRRRLAQELSDDSALDPDGRKFPVVYADPPWRRKGGIGDRSYENHYPTENWDEIIAMPVAQRVLPDAWLFLWIPRAHLLALHPTEIETPLGPTIVKLPLAYAVAQAWGFDAYSTCFVWTKTDENAPEDHGTGLIVWDQDEILCLFKRGRGLPKPDTDAKPRSNYREHVGPQQPAKPAFYRDMVNAMMGLLKRGRARSKPDADVQIGSNHREPAGAHSAKPAFYRDMINAMTRGVPVLELFSVEDDAHPLPANFFTHGNQSKNTGAGLAR